MKWDIRGGMEHLASDEKGSGGLAWEYKQSCQ